MKIEDLEKELENIDISIESKEKIKKEVFPKVIDFSYQILSNFGYLIKGIVIFGSAAKGLMKATSDIDVWVLIDNTSFKTSKSLDEIIITLHELGRKNNLHIQTTLLTDFWEFLRKTAPEIINYLKYGIIVFDSGILKPIKIMIEQGLIGASEEAIEIKKKSAEIKLKKVLEDLKSLVFELRYAAIDACQSVIMKKYKVIPDPKEVLKYLNKMVEEGKLEKEYVEKFEKIDKMWKDIEHENVKEIDGLYLNEALNIAKQIIERMKNE